MTAERRSPLEAWTTRFADASRDPARFAIREVPHLAQLALRGDPARCAAALGVPLEANTWARGRDRELLWLGPDEWLVTGEDLRREALLQSLRAALSGEHHAAVDVSANRAVLELSGAEARAVLAKGCTLELRATVFASPRCAQTLLARAQVLLQALEDAGGIRIFVRNSFAPYLAEWLLDAAAETRASRGLDAERIAARLG